MKKVFGNLTNEKVDCVNKFHFTESIKCSEGSDQWRKKYVLFYVSFSWVFQKKWYFMPERYGVTGLFMVKNI